MLHYQLIIPMKPFNKNYGKQKTSIVYTYQASSEKDAKKKAQEYVFNAKNVKIVDEGPIMLTEGKMQNKTFISEKKIPFIYNPA